jgi:hypothetical protein
MGRMLPLKMNVDEIPVPPDLKKRIEDEIRSSIIERIDVKKSIQDAVLKHREWIEGKCFVLRHEKRWKMTVREICKILSVDSTGNASIVKAWMGKPAWSDIDEFSVYSGGSWDFDDAMDECDGKEFDDLINGIRSMIPSMIPEQKDADNVAVFDKITKIIETSRHSFNLSNLKPTFDLMHDVERLVLDNIDKFTGRCYKDGSGSFHAIIGTGWDKTLEKTYVKTINIDQPLVEMLLDVPTRLVSVGTLLISPFTNIHEIDRKSVG